MINVINLFIRGFVSGLNVIIAGFNKIANTFGSSGVDKISAPQLGRSNNTVINFTVQGSADEKTARLAADLFRQDLNRRGAF